VDKLIELFRKSLNPTSSPLKNGLRAMGGDPVDIVDWSIPDGIIYTGNFKKGA